MNRSYSYDSNGSGDPFYLDEWDILPQEFEGKNFHYILEEDHNQIS